MRVTDADGYVEPRDSISHDWLARLGEWNLAPFLIPNGLANPARYLESIGADILILTGGESIGMTPKRDMTERTLLNYAASRRLPVFGVCRGMQLINDFFGGHTTKIDGHVGRVHSVAVESPWVNLYGSTNTVNSFHTLGIHADKMAPSLRAAAFDSDGHVEALYHPSLPVAGVMWHSERAGAPTGDARLVTALLEKSGC